MNSITSSLVRSLDSMQQFLSEVQDESWLTPAGDLEWSCQRTAAHVADDLFSYASQVIARPPGGYLPIEAVIEDTASHAQVIEAIMVCGRILLNAVDAAEPADRAWHPCGASDPAGFAAMGAVEVLVHTYDIARGLKREWMPPVNACQPLVQRLFPAAPAGSPDEVLLYCCGRIPLGELPRLAQWSWDSNVRP